MSEGIAATDGRRWIVSIVAGVLVSVLVSTAYAIAVGGNRNGALALGLIVGAIVTGRLARVRGVRGWVGAWLLTLAGQFVVGLILLVLVGR